MDNTQTPPQQEVPKQEKKTATKASQKNNTLFKGKSLIVFLSMGLVIMFLLLAVIYLLINNESSTDKKESSEEETEVVEEEEEQEETEEEEKEVTLEPEKKMIAYLKGQNLWVIKEDGTNKKQLTTDGQISTFAWKNDKEISYGQCKSLCKIKTININTKKHSEEVVFEELTQSIIDIDWSKNEEKLAYFYTDDDSDRRLIVKHKDEYDEYVSFDPPQPKDTTFEDQINVEFSPEGDRLLLVNTFLAEDNEYTLFVFDDEGKDIKQFQKATFGSFISNNSFIFKSLIDNLLSKFVIGTDSLTSNLITYPIAYDPLMSPDLNFVSFWNINAENKAELYFHDVAGSPGFIGTNLAKARWLADSDSLVCLQVKPDIKSFVGFESESLVVVQRVGGKITKLDDGDIFKFEIQ